LIINSFEIAIISVF